MFLSFDIDSIAGRDCPGVSCPATVGLSAEDAISICHRAGLSANTRLVDVSEMSPDIEGYRTPRLVVNMFYYFVLGVAMRKKLQTAALRALNPARRASRNSSSSSSTSSLSTSICSNASPVDLIASGAQDDEV